MESPLEVNEVLFLICTFVDCEDLKAFAATSRHIYNVSLPILNQHRARWAKYQSFSESLNDSPYFWHNLTAGLLTTSPAAPYIRRIVMDHPEARDRRAASQIHRFRRDWNAATESEELVTFRSFAGIRRGNRTTRPPESVFDVLRDHVKSTWNLYSERNGIDIDLERSNILLGIRSREPQPFIRAILLPLLPNLRTLKLNSSCSIFQSSLRTAVQDAAIAHSKKLRCHSFAKLYSVDFASEEYKSTTYASGTGGHYDLDFLYSFMALPNLRKISAGSMEASDFVRHESLPPSNVTDIAFYNIDMSTSVFKALLKGGSPLRSVKLSIKAFPKHFDDGEFVNLLCECSQHSLEHIELLRENDVYLESSYLGSRTPKRIQLQGFKQLKKVTINYESLRLETGRMMDLLPASLQTLELHTLRAQEGMPGSVYQMLNNKYNYPDWSELTIRGWVSMKDRYMLISECEKHGVAFSIQPHDT